jgi:hypothetical protein
VPNICLAPCVKSKRSDAVDTNYLGCPNHADIQLGVPWLLLVYIGIMIQSQQGKDSGHHTLPITVPRSAVRSVFASATKEDC